MRWKKTVVMSLYLWLSYFKGQIRFSTTYFTGIIFLKKPNFEAKRLLADIMYRNSRLDYSNVSKRTITLNCISKKLSKAIISVKKQVWIYTHKNYSKDPNNRACTIINFRKFWSQKHHNFWRFFVSKWEIGFKHLFIVGEMSFFLHSKRSLGSYLCLKHHQFGLFFHRSRLLGPIRLIGSFE